MSGTAPWRAAPAGTGARMNTAGPARPALWSMSPTTILSTFVGRAKARLPDAGWRAAQSSTDHSRTIATNRTGDRADGMGKPMKLCRQRQVGIADDKNYHTLLVIQCDLCRQRRLVRPGSEVYCFFLEKLAKTEMGKERTLNDRHEETGCAAEAGEGDGAG